MVITACSGARPVPAGAPIQAEPAAAAAPLVIAPIPAPEPETASAAAVLEGAFSGKIWSAGELAPAETILRLTPSGGAGSYTLTQGEETFAGTLTDCVAAGNRHFSCLWHDPFGSGTLDFAVRADLQGFEGQWWPDNAPQEKYPWFGTRSEPSAAPGAAKP